MAVRIAKVEDIHDILSIYAPYVEQTAYTFEYTVPTVEEFTERFRNITKQFPWLVWEEDGKVLGYAYACAPFERAAFSWCAEPAIYLRPEARGRGIGRALYETLEEYLKRQGYVVSYALITTSNRGSLAFHEAMGYERCAFLPDCGFKHGGWHGIIWMEKRLGVVEMPTTMPTPFPKLVKND